MNLVPVARTDLRIAILEAFRNHGIEIPYPQAEMHLRDLDWARHARWPSGSPGRAGEPMGVRDYKSESHAPGDSDGDNGSESTVGVSWFRHRRGA